MDLLKLYPVTETKDKNAAARKPVLKKSRLFMGLSGFRSFDFSIFFSLILDYLFDLNR